MKSLVKKLVRLACREYSIYFLYSQSKADTPHDRRELGPYRVQAVDRETIEALPDNVLSRQAEYCGEGAIAYACFASNRIVALCFYWHGERYRKRAFWPLSPAEAKLVQIITLPEERGHGVARALIAISSNDMLSNNGFDRLYARIWHSNTPSRKAFKAVGWQLQALVVEMLPWWHRRPLRLQVDLKGSSIKRVRLGAR